MTGQICSIFRFRCVRFWRKDKSLTYHDQALTKRKQFLFKLFIDLT